MRCRAAARHKSRHANNPSDRQRAELTADERQELQEAFQMFDQEATGRIDLHELKVID